MNPDEYRAAVLALARQALADGVREVPPGSNRGDPIDAWACRCVRHGKTLDARGMPWCAIAASAWLWDAWVACVYAERPWTTVPPEAITTWSPADLALPLGAPVVGYRAAVSELVADAIATGTWHAIGDGEPQPGDLLVMGRSGQNPLHGGQGHVAIVDEVVDGGYLAIGGNQGDRVSRVLRSRTDTVEPLLGYIRITD